MTPDEKNLISGLFGRLKDAEASAGPKDAEAEALIKQQVAQQPSAPYLLVQTVLVQEHALNNAQVRIAELERQVQAAAKPAGGGSFLGGAADKLGPWGRRGDTAPQQAQGGYAPMQQPPQPQAPQPGYAPYAATAAMAPQAGGGFLRSALATAAGVAGGALLFQGISGLMHQNAGAFGPALGGTGAAWGGGGTTVNETVNNYYGNDSGSLPSDGQSGGFGPSTDDGRYDTADATDYGSDSGDFGGGDFGGSDDA
jgi:hypothetical protein